jgi:hypothetical protein
MVLVLSDSMHQEMPCSRMGQVANFAFMASEKFRVWKDLLPSRSARGRRAVGPHPGGVRVAQRRCALYGLLIYRQGDTSRFLFGYDFYRNKKALLAEDHDFAYALYAGDPSNGSATRVASFREGRIGYRRWATKTGRICPSVEDRYDHDVDELMA